MDEIAEHGVQVKDPDTGLIDFPAVMGGEPALLCWRVGEQRIEFWHTLGRRLRRPAADRVSAGRHLDAALAAEADAYRGSAWREPRPSELFRGARDAYLASHAETGPSSWGRLMGALKMAMLAGDGVERDALGGRRRDRACRVARRRLRARARPGRPWTRCRTSRRCSTPAARSRGPAARWRRSRPAIRPPIEARSPRSSPTSRPAISTCRASPLRTRRWCWNGWRSRTRDGRADPTAG